MEKFEAELNGIVEVSSQLAETSHGKVAEMTTAHPCIQVLETFRRVEDKVERAEWN